MDWFRPELALAQAMQRDRDEQQRRRLIGQASTAHAHTVSASDVKGTSSVALSVEQRTVEIGSISSSQMVRVPGDFSGVVAMVATLTVDEMRSVDETLAGQPAVIWRLFDAIVNECFWSLEDSVGSYEGRVEHAATHSTRRFVLPMGPQLSVWVAPHWTGGACSPEERSRRSEASGVALHLAVRTFA